MAKRIYFATVRKWLIDKWKVLTGVAVAAGTSIGAVFFYLAQIGAITVLGYSGDMVCAGTLEDPCYAYINFTANEDIFLYPTGYDPWGRDTTFEFFPDIESWELQRSWGSGWRNIPMDKPCTGTWCGAPSSDADTTYSIAFREGRTYQIRIVAYKRDPTHTIKWAAFDGKIDPTWESVKESNLKEGVVVKEIDKKRAVLDMKPMEKDPSYLQVEYELSGEKNTSLDKGVYSVSSSKEEVRVYEKPEGTEYELILKEKPEKNVFAYKMNTSGLDFYYQPPLWQEEGLKGPNKTCNATDCQGSHRPENVVGSYAVYYAGEKKNNEYKTGKAYHIYRPWVEDATGERIWAELSIQESSMTITVPQDFLDKATYPVVIDPTFGYTTIGSSNYNIGYEPSVAGSLYTLSENAIVKNMSVHLTVVNPLQNCDVESMGGIYTDSTYSKLTDSSAVTVSSDGWVEQDLTDTNLTPGDYYIAASGNKCTDFDTKYLMLSYDSVTNDFIKDISAYSAGYSSSMPDPLTDSITSSSRKGSMYVTYDEYVSQEEIINLTQITPTTNTSVQNGSTLNWTTEVCCISGDNCGTQNISLLDDLEGQIISFNDTGTHFWDVPAGVTEVAVLIVGGGGGAAGGGGGAGGLIYNDSYPVSFGETIGITVGAGGAGTSTSASADSGENGAYSLFGTLKALGGGAGGGYGDTGADRSGKDGGSGGGASLNTATTSGGSGLQPASDDGGNGSDGGDTVHTSYPYSGAGGGGANETGGNTTANDEPGDGGDGLCFIDVFGTGYGDSGCFAGGGAGGSNSDNTNGAIGGIGGGGDNPSIIGSVGDNGMANTGGGGGGANGNPLASGDGGSGVVLIKITGYESPFDTTDNNPQEVTLNSGSCENVTWILTANASSLDEYLLYSYHTIYSSEQLYINITSGTSDSCTYSSGNWEVDCSDHCNITSTVDLGGNNISIEGTGTFSTTANITDYDILHIEGTDSSNKCVVTCKSGGCFVQ